MIKMITTRRCYLRSEDKEYEANEPFTITDEREAERLVRSKRARRVPEVALDLKIEAPELVVQKVVPQRLNRVSLDPADEKPRRYMRRDLSAQD